MTGTFYLMIQDKNISDILSSIKDIFGVFYNFYFFHSFIISFLKILSFYLQIFRHFYICYFI